MDSEGRRDGMFVNNGTLRRIKDFGNIQIDDALFVIGHDAFFFFKQMVIGNRYV